MNLTLRDVSEKLEARGERFPTSTLVRVEHGKLDPGVRRLHLLMSLYRIPPQLVADLVELEEHAVREPETTDLEALHRKGVQHLRAGNTAQALAHILALKRLESDDTDSRHLRQLAAIAFASAAKDLGKFHLSRELVEGVLRESPGPPVLVRALVLASGLWQGQGASEVALALIRQAATRVDPADRKQRAWVLHQEAKLLLAAGAIGDAERNLRRVLGLYREIRDHEGEARALILELQVLEARGETDAAIECARRVVETAEKHGHAIPKASGLLELGRLLVRAGSVEEGLEALNASLAEAMLLDNKLIEFHVHYNLWKTYETIGDRDRERFEFEAASYFVRFIDESSNEAREIRDLAARWEETRSGRRRKHRRRSFPVS
jgi:tetratricopeptide (TPR) repeat protein